MGRVLPSGRWVCAIVLIATGALAADEQQSTTSSKTSSSKNAVPTTQPAVANPLDTLSASQFDLSAHFADFDGCFVLVNDAEKTVQRFRPTRCSEQLPPCSTFKVPNSLIALETGVIADADTVFRWDGKQHRRKALNRDHALQSAVKHSVLWYFQEVARRVGQQRMDATLAKLDYGNRDTSAGLTTFWLGESLAISADEQVAFLMKLKQRQLPFSDRAQQITRHVMRQTPDGNLYGKTGSCLAADGRPPVGWFVGWVEAEDTTYYFATNIKGEDAWGYAARDITRAVLASRGIAITE